MARKNSSFLLMILFAFGAGLIWFAFSLLTEGSEVITSYHWLILIVIYFNYLLMFIQIPVLTGNTNSFSIKITGLSISLFTQLVYGLLSIGFILIAYVAKLSFQVQLIGQGIFLFFLMANTFFSVFTGEKSNEVETHEMELLRTLQSAKQEMDRMLLTVKGNELYKEYGATLEKAGEVLKYMSPVDSENARHLDSLIYNSICQLKQLVSSIIDKISYEISKPDVTKAVETLVSSINERKTYRN